MVSRPSAGDQPANPRETVDPPVRTPNTLPPATWEFAPSTPAHPEEREMREQEIRQREQAERLAAATRS